jgi:hypothetical protein
VLERAGRAGIVSRFVAPDPMVDLRRVPRLVVRRVERHDLTPARDCGQVMREGGDPAAPRRIGRDEGGSDDGTPIVTDWRCWRGQRCPSRSMAAEELERHGGPARAYGADHGEAVEARSGPIRRPAFRADRRRPDVDRPSEASADRVLGVPGSTSSFGRGGAFGAMRAAPSGASRRFLGKAPLRRPRTIVQSGKLQRVYSSLQRPGCRCAIETTPTLPVTPRLRVEYPGRTSQHVSKGPEIQTNSVANRKVAGEPKDWTGRYRSQVPITIGAE